MAMVGLLMKPLYERLATIIVMSSSMAPPASESLINDALRIHRSAMNQTVESYLWRFPLLDGCTTHTWKSKNYVFLLVSFAR